jgi:transposase
MTAVEAALARVQTQLGPADYDLFRRLVNTLAAVTAILSSQRTMLARLRRLFGLSSSEKSRDVLRDQNCATDAGPASDNEAAAADADASPDESCAATSSGRQKRKGHGRLPVSMYEAATHIAVPHQSLNVGGCCPDCRSGKLYELKEPAQYLRIFGQPILAGTCWDCQRLRCSSCGSVHTARAPAEAQGPKFDETAVAMIALSRYSVGLPHNRLERMQKHMKLPVPASTQWDVLHDNAPAFEPVFAELERQGAQGEVVHNDDTYARLLAFMGERRAKLLQDADLPDPERVGLFTTAIVSITNEQPLVLFYTGRKYAGENLATLLKARDDELEPPTLMCDGLDSRNLPVGHAVHASSCLAHARRGIVDQVVNFPRECRHVLDELRKVYRIDAQCRKSRLSPAERLAAHQQHSQPIMDGLKLWMQAELDEKRVEPNSGLGQAYKYMLKRWDKLTLFLRKTGAPLDNNTCERALKMAIRHRRNSLFYRSERGAEIGDLFMSLIHTAELRGANPFEYLTAVLRNESAVAANPADWLPWTFRATLARLGEQRAAAKATAPNFLRPVGNS